MEGVPSFGVGTRVNVLPETGGREVAIYEGLSAQTAYLAAMYRHRPELTQRLHAMADLRARAAASERGFIGPGASPAGLPPSLRRDGSQQCRGSGAHRQRNGLHGLHNTVWFGGGGRCGSDPLFRGAECDLSQGLLLL